MLEFLLEQGVNPNLVEEVRAFRHFYKVDTEVVERIPKPFHRYYGKKIWEMAIAALLSGENVLLTGMKATGKNVLAENLSTVFGRPQWTTSFHINIDQGSLIGTDTFTEGEVKFRPGNIYQSAKYGGFSILDEINMAKNEAMAVMYSALDYRRQIDVPGYKQIDLHEATRFIGTMNYGYIGTKELNEAFASRFMVIDIPAMTEDKLKIILMNEFPELNEESAITFAGLFLDLQQKSLHSEISTKAIDLRGLLGAIKAMKRGLNPYLAIQMGIVGKVFDEFEKELVQDVVDLRIHKKVTAESIFEK